MHVAYLCLQPRSGTGAADTHVDGIVGGLRQLGVEVDLIELRTSSESLVVRLLQGLLLQVRHVRRLRAADVVYARMHPTAALLPWLLGRTPYVVEVNGVPEDYVVAHPALQPFRTLIRRGIRHLLARASHVIVVTEGLRVRVREWVPDTQTTVVPNAAEPEIWHPDLPRPMDAPVGDYVIFFGALAPWQGVDLALAATQDPAWPDGVPLVVIGDGPEREKVRSAARRSPDRVRYLGPRPPRRLAAYVANAQLSLCLKQYHDEVAGQSPLKVYESLAAETSVVVTNLHGASDLGAAGLVPVASDDREIAVLVAGLLQAQRSLPSPALGAHESWQQRACQVKDVLKASDIGPVRTARRRRLRRDDGRRRS